MRGLIILEHAAWLVRHQSITVWDAIEHAGWYLGEEGPPTSEECWLVVRMLEEA